MPSSYTFATRHLMDPYQPLGETVVNVLNGDGRCLYEITVNSDGSLTVRTWDMHKRDGEIYEATLLVAPVATNVVRIDCPRYRRDK